MERVSAKWSEAQDTDTLKCLSLSIPHGQFCAIIGAVGAGKVLTFKYNFIFLYSKQSNGCLN